MTTAAPDLKDLLRSAQLPALPQSAIRLLELSQDPDNGPVEFAVPIEADPGLTGQVLKFRRKAQMRVTPPLHRTPHGQ